MKFFFSLRSGLGKQAQFGRYSPLRRKKSTSSNDFMNYVHKLVNL